MSISFIIKGLIILFLVAILISLTVALIHFVQDKGQSDRTVKALTVRISLSIFLFVLVMLAIASGLIKTNTIQ